MQIIRNPEVFIKYLDIIKYIKNEIKSGNFIYGQRLPSVRELSKTLNCNKATASHAYAELINKHIIYTKPKSGYFLLEQADLKEKYEEKIIDLATGMPDPSIIPYEDFTHCINRAVSEYAGAIFTSLPPEGLFSLRKTLSSFFTDYQIFAPPESIFITSGVQQALSMLSFLPFSNAKTMILVEQPTYLGLMDAAKAFKSNITGVIRNENGIDLNELEKIFSTAMIKFFYTMPRMHNPLGTSLSLDEKKHLIKLAYKYNVYIVEDDYCADLESDSKSDPLYALDPEKERVIYLKSFSKTLMPGLRIGAVILPPLMRNIFKNYRRSIDLGNNILLQKAFEIFIQSKMINNHLKKIRMFYKERMDALRTACNKFLPELKAYIPENGVYTSIKVPCHAGLLKEKLYYKNIRIKNTSMSCLSHFASNDMIRISICRAKTDEIGNGISLISETIGELTHTLIQSESTEMD